MTLVPEARAAVLAWYDARGRALPFRRTRDPWAILVSEAMAQQTQAARAGERWLAFMGRYPTAAALAAATPADVIRAWQGLGYNRRALALWRAARMISQERAGRVPDDLAALERLPGVGPYTARAVAAIAFGRPVGAVDTNVRRVLGRLTGTSGVREMQALADQVVPAARPGDWTHALMDIGATLCGPRRPLCEACPVRNWCRYITEVEASAPPRQARNPAVPFPRTTRWLRGRILDRLRAAAGDAWVDVVGPIGDHDVAAVANALQTLVRDGLAQRHPTDPGRARLPLG